MDVIRYFRIWTLWGRHEVGGFYRVGFLTKTGGGRSWIWNWERGVGSCEYMAGGEGGGRELVPVECSHRSRLRVM